MSLDILCTPFFNATEEKEITAAAAKLKMSKDEFVRAAVRHYSSVCVPTHKKTATATR